MTAMTVRQFAYLGGAPPEMRFRRPAAREVFLFPFAVCRPPPKNRDCGDCFVRMRFLPMRRMKMLR